MIALRLDRGAARALSHSAIAKATVEILGGRFACSTTTPGLSGGLFHTEN
ncbi:hypothetical protein [Brevundimonas sp. GCM10030266]